MRIIAGRFKRRTIESPPGDAARPTTDRTRESMFNLIQHRIELVGAQVLDLFAGTGALGLEAWSRGAAHMTFVDSNPDMMDLVRRNAEVFEDHPPCIYEQKDAVKFLLLAAENRTGRGYDLILADPPYDWPLIGDLPEKVCPFLDEDGIFVLEHDRRVDFGEEPRLETERSYGRSHVSVFTRS